MRTIALIPARGGSKGIPAKNLQTVNGRTLVARSISSAIQSNCFAQVYVSTDDHSIAEEAEKSGATVFMRPAELARDESSSESVLVHHLSEGAAAESDLAKLNVTQSTPTRGRRESIGSPPLGMSPRWGFWQDITCLR
jgi:CMP-N-acetylneuraminic acid synthetase